MTPAGRNGAWLSLALLVPAAVAGCRSAVRDFYEPLASGSACTSADDTGGGGAVASEGGGGQPSGGMAGCPPD